MFLGTYEPNLMPGGRIALPKKIREELNGSRLVLTISIGDEPCIYGFSDKMWESATKPELDRPLFSDKVGRDLRRKVFSEAINLELDSQGRCIIPERMIKGVDIKTEVVVKGNGDHFEIWSKQKWQEYEVKNLLNA